MRQRHDNLRTRRPMTAAGLAAASWMPCAVSGDGSDPGRSAQAQFSGPALGASTPVNPPVTITTDPAILYPANRDVYLGHG